MKKIWIAGVAAMMIWGLGMQADAGFNLGGIANRAVNKAVDEIFSSGSRNKTENNAEQRNSKQSAKAQEKSKVSHDGGVTPTAFYGELDPLPPADVTQRPDWFQKRRDVETMTNARLVAEYENLLAWQEQAKTNGDDVDVPDLLRRDELYHEISKRVGAINNYVYYTEADVPEFAEENLSSDFFKRGVASNIKPLYEYGLHEDITGAMLPGYHPERN